MRTTITVDEGLAAMARRLGVNLSAAARAGIGEAVRQALAEADRAAYQRHPEASAQDWAAAEAWGDE